MSQNDLAKDISNASGSSVRTDINNNLEDLNTFNSGTSAPATNLVDFMSWGDANVGTKSLKIYNSAGFAVVWSPNFVISTDGTVAAAADTNITCTFGRSKLGSPVSDEATFAHFDQMSTTNYCIKHSATGETTINMATGKDLLFHENDTQFGKMQIADTDEFTLRLGANATVIAADNFKTGIATAVGANERIHIQGTSSAGLQLVDQGATADERMISITSDDGVGRIASVDDSASINNTFMTFDLSGTATPRINMSTLPSSASGLATGDLWNNLGVMNIA